MVMILPNIFERDEQPFTQITASCRKISKTYRGLSDTEFKWTM